MYVVTFYSFKGGVGRSMALINVAAELTKRKKRVLIVDFDLEAPGLDTFDITHSPANSKGILDFVWDYGVSGDVPDVRDYVYMTTATQGDGELWVMPAGLQDSSYDQRFRAINWEDLYSRQEGFLLMEDLKAQWKEILSVDYVLIDSRTGHTDVGGICTRQLPDAVVAFFFPNEQNRRGLQSVVSQIRGEEAGPLKKKIELHFVLSNVPDLDDEDEILQNEISLFQTSLKFPSPSAIIHHYDSLALLEQVTFTRARPRSRLAKEYTALADKIIRKNLSDREGALAFLDSIEKGARRSRFVQSHLIRDTEDDLQKIRITHKGDAEVLAKLAAGRVRQRKDEEALAIFSEAINLGANVPDLLIRRAQLYFALGQKEQALGDLKRIVSLSDVTSYELAISIRMLREIQSDLVEIISRSPALDNLEPDLDLVRELQSSPETLQLAVSLLTRWSTSDSVYKDELSISLIGKGEYSSALAVIGAEHVRPENLDIQDCFNYAMAKWGRDGKPPLEYFQRVVDLGQDDERLYDANYFQCISIASYLIGEQETAARLAKSSKETISNSRASSFSCWSYLYVSVGRFLSDLEEMDEAFKAGHLIPKFLLRNPPTSKEGSVDLAKI